MKTLGETGEKVIKLMLEVFKHEQELDHWFGEQSIFKGTDKAGFNVFRLMLKQGRERQKRNISIKPLGEAGKSKSSVFLVKYDDNIVVKVPPLMSPINSLAEFLEAIKKENKIKERLKPRVAIVPGLAVIMKKVVKFKGFSKASAQQLEAPCAKRLAKEPKLQKYFQIDNDFVLFLNLSSYRLAIDVIEDVVERKVDKVEKDLTYLVRNIRDYHLIEEEFGGDIFSLYEWAEKFIVSIRGISDRHLSDHELAKIFRIFLANKKVKADSTFHNLAPETIKEINNFLVGRRKESLDNISTLRKIIEKHVFHGGSWNGADVIKSLIIKKLELLAFLEKKGLVIKDMKSDGLLIVPKDPTANFTTTIDTGEFDFGLLDVEYGTFWKDTNGKPFPVDRIEQPGCAYTPRIGTITHIFFNSILSDALGNNLGRIFKLQDWYAGINFIYQAATLYKFTKGERIFQKTGANLNRLVEKIASKAGKQQPVEIFKELSLGFWNVALEEFSEKIKADKEFLVKESIVLPKTVCAMFVREIEIGIKDVFSCIKNLLASNKYINQKQRNFLIQCNSSQIEKLLKVWGKKEKNRRASSIVELLKTLLPLRVSLERKARTKVFFAKSKVTILVYQLLRIMFNLVCNGMYKSEWGELRLDIKPVQPKITDTEIERTIKATVILDPQAETQELL